MILLLEHAGLRAFAAPPGRARKNGPSFMTPP